MFLHLCVGVLPPCVLWVQESKLRRTHEYELETFVEQVMDKQQYRSGIFTNWLDKILQGITDFRGAPNIEEVIRSKGWQVDG